MESSNILAGTAWSHFDEQKSCVNLSTLAVTFNRILFGGESARPRLPNIRKVREGRVINSQLHLLFHEAIGHALHLQPNHFFYFCNQPNTKQRTCSTYASLFLLSEKLLSFMTWFRIRRGCTDIHQTEGSCRYAICIRICMYLYTSNVQDAATLTWFGKGIEDNELVDPIIKLWTQRIARCLHDFPASQKPEYAIRQRADPCVNPRINQPRAKENAALAVYSVASFVVIGLRFAFAAPLAVEEFNRNSSRLRLPRGNRERSGTSSSADHARTIQSIVTANTVWQIATHFLIHDNVLFYFLLLRGVSGAL